MLPSSAATTEYGLTGGPRWYQRRIRVFGPFLALLVPGLVGAAAYAALKMSDAAWSGTFGTAASYFAAPALLAIGGPLADAALKPLAMGASALMWLLAGVLASRRATRNPFATWSDFWRHYSWMLFGIWVGVMMALAIASAWIGPDLIDLI
jgi:hypothetical protein